MTAFVRHPVDNPVISQPFGAPNTWENPPYHKGIDYAAPEGTPIYAPCDGFIVWASGQPFGYGNTWEMIPGNGNSGNCVILQPPAPHTALQTSFSHMSRIAVTAGQWVTAGTLLGYVGSTGFSFGAHLHWEAFIDYAEGVYPAGTFYGRVNPLDYFNTATVVPLGTGGKGSTTPDTKGFLMALTDEQQKHIYDRIMGGIPGGAARSVKAGDPAPRLADSGDIADLHRLALGAHDVTRTHLINTSQAQHDVTRAHVINSVTAAGQAQEDVTRQYLSDRITEGAKPSEVADSVIAALGTDLAAQVVTELAARLAGGTK